MDWCRSNSSLQNTYIKNTIILAASSRMAICGLAHRAAQIYLTGVLPTHKRAMATAKKLMTTVSTKGQIILPKAIRQQRRWEAGTQLVVEDTRDGVLLKAAPLFAPPRPKDVFGSL